MTIVSLGWARAPASGSTWTNLVRVGSHPHVHGYLRDLREVTGGSASGGG